ncbi:MAG: hypothetical protein KME06_12445 [Kastovskya adunca ATA6-11-RM4]|nr:hypothetical protein [Kastovskya adunca ATA6-11-RM4]
MVSLNYESSTSSRDRLQPPTTVPTFIVPSVATECVFLGRGLLGFSQNPRDRVKLELY